MAFVKNFQYMFNNEHIKQKINVGSDGHFYTDFPKEIGEKINCTNRLSSSSLSNLEKSISEKIDLYRKSVVKYEELIGISFLSSGWYFQRDWEYKFKSHQFNSTPSSICFEYRLYIKEIRDSGVVMHDAGRVQDLEAELESFRERIVDKLFKRGICYNHLSSEVYIPYSDEAFASIETAKIGLSKISKTLYDFISQEPAMIEGFLKGEKLLN